MKVQVTHHYGAALLTDETGKTLLLQDSQDIESVMGKDWDSGTAEIDDEFQPLFEGDPNE